MKDFIRLVSHSTRHFLHSCIHMAAHFWGSAPGVLRDEDGNQDYATNGFAVSHQGDMMNSGWFWGSNDMFESTPSLLFDLNENNGGFGKLSGSEPVSPSSVDTTPTTSEIPVMSNERHLKSNDSHLLTAHTINVSKRARKSLPSNQGVSVSNSMDRNGRKKKYDAPPGVWRNSGGFISTVYINKKRVYGPLRRDVNDAVRDREEMLLAKSVIHTEEGMRAFVQGMKERFGADRQAITLDDIHAESLSGSQFVRPSVSSAPVSATRTSSRPVRAAAKRNVFAAFASDNPMDEEDNFDDSLEDVNEEDYMDEPMLNGTSFF